LEIIFHKKKKSYIDKKNQFAEQVAFERYGATADKFTTANPSQPRSYKNNTKSSYTPFKQVYLPKQKQGSDRPLNTRTVIKVAETQTYPPAVNTATQAKPNVPPSSSTSSSNRHSNFYQPTNSYQSTSPLYSLYSDAYIPYDPYYVNQPYIPYDPFTGAALSSFPNRTY